MADNRQFFRRGSLFVTLALSGALACPVVYAAGTPTSNRDMHVSSGTPPSTHENKQPTQETGKAKHREEMREKKQEKREESKAKPTT